MILYVLLPRCISLPQREVKTSQVHFCLLNFFWQNTTDAIGRAAAEAMQGPIQAAYKDAFQSIVLPVFERGCQSMFQQINDSFKQGTNECKSSTERHL